MLLNLSMMKVLVFLLAVVFELHSIYAVSKFAHQVLVQAVDGTSEDHCSGVLVQFNWAMSTVRCIRELFNNNREIHVIAGFSPKRKDYTEIRRAIQYVDPPGNDDGIALIRLAEPFTQSKELQLAKIPHKGEKICSNPESIVIFPYISEDEMAVTPRGLITAYIKWRLLNLGKIFIAKAAEKLVEKIAAKLRAKRHELQEKMNEWMIKKAEDLGIEETEQYKKIIAELEKAVDELSILLEATIKQMARDVILKGSNQEVKDVKSLLMSLLGIGKRETGGEKVNITVFSGLMAKGPTHLCEKHRGYPLMCGDKVFGVQWSCKQSQTRSTEDEVIYHSFDADLEFIETTAAAPVLVSQAGLDTVGNGGSFLKLQPNTVVILVVVVRSFL